MKRLKFPLMVLFFMLLFSTNAISGWFGKSDEEKLRDAAEAGDIELVTALLEGGADINWGDQYTGTALHRAAYKGHARMVEFLLDKGANVNAEIEPGLLTVFSKTRDEDNGKLSSVENAHWATPLHLAVENNHFPVVRILVEDGARLHSALTLGYDRSKPQNLRTPLDIARSKGLSEIVDYLEQNE